MIYVIFTFPIKITQHSVRLVELKKSRKEENKREIKIRNNCIEISHLRIVNESIRINEPFYAVSHPLRKARFLFDSYHGLNSQKIKKNRK